MRTNVSFCCFSVRVMAGARNEEPSCHGESYLACTLLERSACLMALTVDPVPCEALQLLSVVLRHCGENACLAGSSGVAKVVRDCYLKDVSKKGRSLIVSRLYDLGESNDVDIFVPQWPNALSLYLEKRQVTVGSEEPSFYNDYLPKIFEDMHVRFGCRHTDVKRTIFEGTCNEVSRLRLRTQQQRIMC